MPDRGRQPIPDRRAGRAANLATIGGLLPTGILDPIPGRLRSRYARGNACVTITDGTRGPVSLRSRMGDSACASCASARVKPGRDMGASTMPNVGTPNVLVLETSARILEQCSSHIKRGRDAFQVPAGLNQEPDPVAALRAFAACLVQHQADRHCIGTHLNNPSSSIVWSVRSANLSTGGDVAVALRPRGLSVGGARAATSCSVARLAQCLTRIAKLLLLVSSALRARRLTTHAQA